MFTGYRPLHGARARPPRTSVAFARSAALVAVATRLPVGLAAAGGWGDTVLPLPGGAADWHDMLTGTPVDGSHRRWSTCSPATRSRCWSALLTGPGGSVSG